MENNEILGRPIRSNFCHYPSLISCKNDSDCKAGFKYEDTGYKAIEKNLHQSN